MKKNQNNDEYKCEFQPILLIYFNFDPTDDLNVVWTLTWKYFHRIQERYWNFNNSVIHFATHSFPNRSWFYIPNYLFMGAFDAIFLTHLPVNKSCTEKMECRTDHNKSEYIQTFVRYKEPRNIIIFIVFEMWRRISHFSTAKFPIRVSDHCACFSYIVSVHNLIFLWMEYHSPN